MGTAAEKIAQRREPSDLSASRLPAQWRFWRSPPDQPPFARPALLAIACVAGLAYAWGSNNAHLEPFYGAAARSMSTSWHDFLFGAFDPAGTVTVDKLPGALWVQALSLRVLGFHVWVVVLPQIVEGVLTILVLYRAVRRLVGPVAGIVAAVALASSPITVALNRGNVSDSLLILLTVLAADATSAALLRGSLRWLLLAGMWVGLAFQAKMLQAWLVLPAMGAAYLLAAPGPLRRRAGHLVLAGTLSIVVSLSWMSVVSLVPAGQRPYVDGTQDDSLFAQVFDYNGFARLGKGPFATSAGPPAPFFLKLLAAGDVVGGGTEQIEPSWHRLLEGPLGRDDGWLLPAALIAAAAVLVCRRRAGRRDPMRAAVVLWGSWLAVLAATFSASRYVNSYYVAALTPATAALCGTGAALFWHERQRRVARLAVALALLASAGYGASLLVGGDRVPAWLLPLALCLALAATVVILFAPRALDRPRFGGVVVTLVFACALPLTAVTALLVTTRALGPFATPYEPARLIATASHFSAQREGDAYRGLVDRLLSTYRTPVALGADTSALAAAFIYYTGAEVLPIGGYDGGVPAPTLPQLEHDVASGEVSVFLIPVEPRSPAPRVAWIQTHCAQLMAAAQSGGVEFAFYHCPATGA
jgi:4-amino-4-deoxy-L-arabinose transferase-like glycosyltransferase